MGQFSKMGNSSPPYQSCNRRSHRRRVCSQHNTRTATLRRRSWRARAIQPHMAANYRARQSYPGEQRMADSIPQKNGNKIFFPGPPDGTRHQSPRWYQRRRFIWFPRWYQNTHFSGPPGGTTFYILGGSIQNQQRQNLRGRDSKTPKPRRLRCDDRFGRPNNSIRCVKFRCSNLCQRRNLRKFPSISSISSVVRIIHALGTA